MEEICSSKEVYLIHSIQKINFLWLHTPWPGFDLRSARNFPFFTAVALKQKHHPIQ